MATDFEARLADFCQTILVPGDVVVDVGAHLGRHTIPFARAVGPSGKVIAFEPIPHINGQLQQILRDQAAARPMAPVRLFDVALGPAREQTTFVVVPQYPEYSGLQERTYDQGEDVERHRIPIQVEVLDDLLRHEPRIDLVKIDTEGGEFGVLCGAARILDEQRPVVTFECGDNSLVHYEHTAGDLFDLLANHGYRVENINRQPLNRSAFVGSSREQSVWDYLAFPVEWSPTAVSARRRVATFGSKARRGASRLRRKVSPF